MLVLARKLHQSILIGDTIRITVLEVRDGQVRLGIDAPRNLSILREEIMHSAACANREALPVELADGSVGALWALLHMRVGGWAGGGEACDTNE